MYKSLKIKTRYQFIFGFSFLVLSIVIMTVISFNSITRLNKSHDIIIEKDRILNYLLKIRTEQNTYRSLTLEIQTTKNAIEADSLKERMKTLVTNSYVIFSNLDSLIKGKEEYASMVSIKESSYKFVALRDKYETLIKEGKTDEANYIYNNELKPLTKELYTVINSIENELNNSIVELLRENDKLTRNVNITLFSLGLTLILISFAMAFLMQRLLVKVSTEIKKGVGILGSSASEILSTVTEIYTGAAETATAVSETTTTVEEVRQTAMVSNQKAQSLMLSSQKAADSAERGKESINEVIDAMKNIDNQMLKISETINKLSEQNRTIGEITSTVADIADQSNLLAVNAAIEAAKAGEHGRGFSVVAQEIRSLADQSKRATAQVKEILNEINKSVNMAVGATDTGSRTVEDGKRLVRECEEAIDILSDNVEEATQASIQISSSNQQQMAGMEQIVPAMENIKQASEQNVAGIKQTQTAANDLKQLGMSLQEIMEKYKL